MTTETVTMSDRTPVSIWKKLNPLWWLVGPDGWSVPNTNNGEPYLPEVTNIWLRRFYWFFCRNPLMNFVGYVLGVEDKNYSVIGTAPVLVTTGRDETPRTTGWKWAVLMPPFSPAAYVMSFPLFFLSGFVHWAFALPAVWSLLKACGPLPYVAYYNGRLEFYCGWRPVSGGFGTKLVFRND